MPDQTLLFGIRAQLEDERARVRARIHGLTGEDSSSRDENFADSGQVAALQGETLKLLGQYHDQLAIIDRTLQKLDDGTFGMCESCGGPIGEARLEAMPATRFCIAHA
jgi:DnaK suppressor protein